MISLGALPCLLLISCMSFTGEWYLSFTKPSSFFLSLTFTLTHTHMHTHTHTYMHMFKHPTYTHVKHSHTLLSCQVVLADSKKLLLCQEEFLITLLFKPWLFYSLLTDHFISSFKNAYIQVSGTPFKTTHETMNPTLMRDRWHPSHGVGKHGWAGWQGNDFSSKEACRGHWAHGVNKKM